MIPPQAQVRDGHVHHEVIGPMPGVVALENESVTSPSSLRQDDLFREIYNAARRVGYGMTITYGGLAKANGRTDWEAVALIIPRHRVLAVGGKIGGFSAPGGAETKEKMLALEGVRLEPKQTPFEILGAVQSKCCGPAASARDSPTRRAEPCAGLRRSGLVDRGFKVWRLGDGSQEWKAAGLPVA